MLKHLFHWQIRRFEREFDYDAAYMHELADLDTRAFWAFSRVARAGEYRGSLPAAAFHAAKLAAVLHEDCGPCAQLVIRFALAAGIEPASVAALAAGDLAAADADSALAFRFARAVLEHDTTIDSLAHAVSERFGPQAPAVLGMALSIGRMYPVLKRAMGHAHSCTRLEVAGRTITPLHA